MVSKSVKRKLMLFLEDKCAVCGCCHAAVHGRRYNIDKPNWKTSIRFDEAKPILDEYFANKIGAKETKERLKLSQKTHLSESALYKRYKREHSIKDFYNNVDLISSKRRNNVPETMSSTNVWIKHDKSYNVQKIKLNR